MTFTTFYDKKINSAQYWDEGYLFPIPVFTPERVKRIYDEAIAVNPKNLFINPHLNYSWAMDVALEPALLNGVSQILGPNLLIHSSSFFIKMPGEPSFVCWHQDTAYKGMTPADDYLTAWISITDSQELNGCMRFIQNSHTRGKIPFELKTYENNMLVMGYTTVLDYDKETIIDVTLKAGEVSFHHGFMVHGSEPNQSQNPRMGYAIRFITPELRSKQGFPAAVLACGCDQNQLTRNSIPRKNELLKIENK